MKIRVFIPSALIGLLSFSACEKGNFNDSTKIAYGTSFGLCVDYCVKELSLNQSKAAYIKSKNGANPDTKVCTKPILEADFLEIRQLLEASNFESLPEKIGCPDCADDGAEWVEVTHNGKTYKVTYVCNKPPKELVDVVAKLKTMSDSFNGCN
jgi:hypothetical protein